MAEMAAQLVQIYFPFQLDYRIAVIGILHGLLSLHDSGGFLASAAFQ